MGRLAKYYTCIVFAIATLAGCVNDVPCSRQTAKSQEFQSDPSSPAPVSAITQVEQVAPFPSRDLPFRTLTATPSDSASVSLLGAILSVPLGSVSTDLTLSITALNTSDLPPLPQGMVNVTRSAAGFRFLPHGEHFNCLPAHISIPVDSLLIPQGYTHSDVFVYFYDEEKNQWTALTNDSTNHSHSVVCALTSHFTDMIAGVLQVPEMPETRGFVPTEMNGIKAADPLQGIISIQTPRAVQNGAATLSFPIVTPAGRNGMQPSLALTYNSESRSGWCGYGWNLPMPSIDIDTRWGVPRFDEEFETEAPHQLNHQRQLHRGGSVIQRLLSSFHR